jgi:hypothetical protein
MLGDGWIVRVYPSGENELQIYTERIGDLIVPDIVISEIVKTDAPDIAEQTIAIYAKISGSFIMLVDEYHSRCHEATWKRKRSDNRAN